MTAVFLEATAPPDSGPSVVDEDATIWHGLARGRACEQQTALISASRGPVDAGIIRAIASPRSVNATSSPRVKRANTFDVS